MPADDEAVAKIPAPPDANQRKAFKRKLKELTRKTTPMSFDQRVQRLSRLKRGCRVAQSPILKTTIILARLKKRGYIAMVELYHPDHRRGQGNKPTTRPVGAI